MGESPKARGQTTLLVGEMQGEEAFFEIYSYAESLKSLFLLLTL